MNRLPHYFKKRNRRLARMGFKSYHQYLQSDLWRSIRVRVMAKYKGLCMICKEPATEVHHQSYGNRILRGRSLAGLRALCSECHHEHEFEEDKKLPFNEVTQIVAESIRGRRGVKGVRREKPKPERQKPKDNSGKNGITLRIQVTAELIRIALHPWLWIQRKGDQILRLD